MVDLKSSRKDKVQPMKAWKLSLIFSCFVFSSFLSADAGIVNGSIERPASSQVLLSGIFSKKKQPYHKKYISKKSSSTQQELQYRRTYELYTLGEFEAAISSARDYLKQSDQ